MYAFNFWLERFQLYPSNIAFSGHLNAKGETVHPTTLLYSDQISSQLLSINPQTHAGSKVGCKRVASAVFFFFQGLQGGFPPPPPPNNKKLFFGCFSHFLSPQKQFPAFLEKTLQLKPAQQLLSVLVNMYHCKNTWVSYFNHIFRLSQLHQCDQGMLSNRFSCSPLRSFYFNSISYSGASLN